MESDPIPYLPRPFEISGFDISAIQHPDGQIELLGNHRMLEHFPDEIQVCGVVYTLERSREIGTMSDTGWPILSGEYV